MYVNERNISAKKILKFSLFIEQIYGIMITNKEAHLLRYGLDILKSISVLPRTMLHIDYGQ